MSSAEQPRIRLDRAVSALPELEDLRALREVLVESSRLEAGQALSAASRLATVDRRLADLGLVEARVPALAERVRERTERVMGRVVSALRALEAGEEAEAARLLNAAGEIEESHGRLEEAEAYYAKALELGRRPRDRTQEPLALRRLARVARARGKLDAAQALYTRSMELANDLRDDAGVMIGCMGIGHVLVDQGRWSDARDWYLRAAERVTQRATPEFIHLCNSLSVAERRLGDLEASETWLARGEAALPRVQDASAAAYLDHGRAKLHLARGDVEAAEAVFERALQRPLDSRARVIALINLAETLLEGNRHLDAEAMVRRAEEEAITHGDLSRLPYVYTLLGQLAARRRDPDGFVFFEQALDVVRERGLPEVEHATVQREYGIYEAALGHSDAAAARLRIAANIYRALGSEAEAVSTEREIRRLGGDIPETTEGDDGKQ